MGEGTYGITLFVVCMQWVWRESRLNCAKTRPLTWGSSTQQVGAECGRVAVGSSLVAMGSGRMASSTPEGEGVALLAPGVHQAQRVLASCSLSPERLVGH